MQVAPGQELVQKAVPKATAWKQNRLPSHCASLVQREYAGRQSAGQFAAPSTPSSQTPLPQVHAQLVVHPPPPTLPGQPAPVLSHSSPGSTRPLPQTGPESAQSTHARFCTAPEYVHSQSHEFVPPMGRDSSVFPTQSQPPPTATLPGGQVTATPVPKAPALTCWKPDTGLGAARIWLALCPPSELASKNEAELRAKIEAAGMPDDVKAVASPGHELNAAYRQLGTYWEMVYGLVRHGIVHPEYFMETNGEGIFLYAKVEPYLEQLRKDFNPTILRNTEWVAKETERGRALAAMFKARVQKVLAEKI